MYIYPSSNLSPCLSIFSSSPAGLGSRAISSGSSVSTSYLTIIISATIISVTTIIMNQYYS